MNNYSCIENIYGQSIRESDWDDYINSSRGAAEYLLAIAVDAKTNHLKTKQDVFNSYNFDEATVDEFIKSWLENKQDLKLSKKVINQTEDTIRKLGFNI